MQRKAFVLLSGGLDSTTALYLAYKEFESSVEAVSFDYGQRHQKELEYARNSCAKLNIPHRVVSLGGLLSGTGVMLTDASVAVPDIAYSEIKGVSPTYVPYRNGTMLSVITALAQKYVMGEIDARVDELAAPDHRDGDEKFEMEVKQAATEQAKDLCSIYAGMHAEDAANHAYPDCTFEFLGAQANAIYSGTYNTVRLITPFVFSSKADIITLGMKLGVPYEDTWSCYKGEELHCGTCPTCRSRRESFQFAGHRDPTKYAV